MYSLMIVDDEYEIRNGLCNYFPWAEISFEVIGLFENGKQALDFFKSNKVDVVLCDIKMPVMTGIDFAKEIFERHPGQKIVFLSGYKDFEYARKALKYGIKDYIVKPTQYNELYEVFNRLKLELDQEFLSKHQELYCEMESKSNKSGNINERVISIIKDYVETHYKDACLESAAKLVNMNLSYVSKYFKEKTGENFSDYLLKIKMGKSIELLKDIKYKTYEVGYMIGYSDAKNFSRTFKKYFGKSPREFRNCFNIE